MNHQLNPIKLTAPGKPFLSMLKVTPTAFDSLIIQDQWNIYPFFHTARFTPCFFIKEPEKHTLPAWQLNCLPHQTQGSYISRFIAENQEAVHTRCSLANGTLECCPVYIFSPQNLNTSILTFPSPQKFTSRKSFCKMRIKNSHLTISSLLHSEKILPSTGDNNLKAVTQKNVGLPFPECGRPDSHLSRMI